MEQEFKTPAQILNVEPVMVPCRDCGTPVEHPYPKLAARGIICESCLGKDSDRILAAAKAKSGLMDVSGWNKLCPLTFQDTEPHRLPSPTKLQKVMAWQFGPKGLLLLGPTGTGKTRCLYVLLKREFSKGRTISVLDHSSAFRYAERFNESPAAVNHWMEHKCNVDILALDDIFKARLTDSFEQAIFTIISQRTERGRPVLLTTNDTGESLVDRMSADRGPALVRRLREYCESISFA